MGKTGYNMAVKIADFLSRYQKDEGLEDSEERKIVKNSYGTEFYALLCALLFKKTKSKMWEERALEAIESSLEIRKERLNTEGIFRWEFKNYAMLSIYRLLKDDIHDDLKAELAENIMSSRNLHSFETNWIMMRALNFMLRHAEFSNPLDLLKAKSNLFAVLERQTEEGFFPDSAGSYSSQYHAYVIALLYQYYEITGDEKVKTAFMKGIECSIRFMDLKADFGFGRGEKQIFGYAGMVFALCGAAKIAKDASYRKVAEKILSHVSKYVNKKNNYPIVLPGGKTYSYNHKSDYLPFFAYYIMLSDEINSENISQRRKIRLGEKREPKKEKQDILAYCLSKFVYFMLPHFFRMIFMPREFWLTFKYRKKHG